MPKQSIDWGDLDSVAKLLAGNWRKFECFIWHRGYDLENADDWMIFYTYHRDSGLLAQSNHDEIAKRLEPFMDEDDPDVLFESHTHWAVGYVNGFSIRVYKADRSITPAFAEFCRIKQDQEDYPILNESDYSDREYEATLENYRCELWLLRDQLPEGWEEKVYSWFSDHGLHQHIENRDDQGGWAPKEKLMEALGKLGLTNLSWRVS